MNNNNTTEQRATHTANMASYDYMEEDSAPVEDQSKKKISFRFCREWYARLESLPLN